MNMFFLCIMSISVFEIHAQQPAVVLSDLHAGIGNQVGDINNPDKFLMAEVTVNAIEMLGEFTIRIILTDSSAAGKVYHYTVMKIQNEYVIKDGNGNVSAVKNNKIQILTWLDVKPSRIKSVEFSGISITGISSNTLIKQF